MNTLEKIVAKYSLEIKPDSLMPFELRGVVRNDLGPLFKELGFKVGAEIGVLKGEFSEILIKDNPELKLYCIDPWDEGGFFTYKEALTKDYSTAFLKKCYAEALDRLSKYNCEIIKKDSMAAAKSFEDNSLDFVYIDGDHTFRHVVNDICEWIEKVRPGGILCGHDYRRIVQLKGRCHVVEALSGYTTAYQIRPWFVLGKKSDPRPRRDKERSWMIVKEPNKIYGCPSV